MRLNRFFLTIFGICLVETNLFAQHVTESDALQKAQAFLNQKATKGGRRGAPLKMKQLEKASQNDAYYIFNAEQNGGFVIVSGDERTEAILGYCTEGNIDLENMPENMKALLKGYEEQIKAIPNDFKAVPSKMPTHPAVEPMLTTRWGQGMPYNLECPTDIPEGETEPQHCPTGCVATAMAQIMYYHKWPKGMTTAIPAYDYGYLGWNEDIGNIYKSREDQLPPTTFDWEHMKDIYVSTSSGVSASAVAHLMRYCGQAFKMSYELDESLANLMEFRSIYEHLGYSDKARMINFFWFSIEEWDEIIYHEIQSRRPVLYSGGISRSFSHAFVCDGYDGNGFYHFNFGWDGYTNYYGRLLAGPKVLSPNGNFGIISSYEPFLINPQAVIGIQKDDDHAEDVFTEHVISRFVIDEYGYNHFVYSNLSNSDLLIDAGFYCINMNDLSTTPIRVSVQNWSLPFSSALFVDSNFSSEDFTEGIRYRIVPVWKESSEAEWHIAENKHTAFLEVVDGSIIVTPLKTIDYDVSIELEGSLVDNTSHNNTHNGYSVTFKNNGADLIRTFYISHLDLDGNVLREYDLYLSLLEGEEVNVVDHMQISEDNIGTYSIVVSEDYARNNIIAKKDFKISRRMQIFSTDGEYDWKTKTLSAKICNKETSMSYNQEVRAYFYHSDSDYPYAVKSTRVSLAPGDETIVTFDCHDVPFNFTDGVSVIINLNEYEERYPTYRDYWWDLHFTGLKRITFYDGFYYDNGSGQYLCYVIDDVQNKCYINSINASQPQETIPGKVKRPYSNKWFDVVGIPTVSYGDYFGSIRNFIHRGVEKIIVEEGIETIGNFVLQDSCQILQSIVFPTTLRYIGSCAMGNCPKLKSIYCKAEIPPIIRGTGIKNEIAEKSIVQTDFTYVGGDGVMEDVHNVFNYDDVTLYVPIGCKKAYAEVWGAFNNIVEMDVKDMPSTEPDSPNIIFADANVKALCAANWDTNSDGELSEAEAAAVTDLGEVFKGNTEITSFNELQYFTGLTSIGNYAFDGCRGLNSIEIPNCVTSIGDFAFIYCDKLPSITIPNSVTSIGFQAFGSCSGLTSIEIPNSVKSIGAYAFHICSNLKSLTIPNSVISIGQDAFSACSSITSIDVSKSNPVYDSRDNCNAIIETSTNQLIKGCQNTIIPNSVTSIGFAAFSGCTGLTSLSIPNSVTSIGSWAFYDCTIMTSVTSEIKSPFAFGPCAFMNISSSCTLTVPKGTKEAYIAAGWTEDIFMGGIFENLPGDGNGDGVVDISDYIGVANHILGNTPDGFNVDAADVNKDGVIDISDYIGVANIILTGSPTGK